MNECLMTLHIKLILCLGVIIIIIIIIIVLNK